MLVTVL